jgi:signal transduction histidine kinase
MSVQHIPTSSRNRSNAIDPRLHGRWLLLARVGWGALVVLTLGIFFASLPVYVAQLQTPCAGRACYYTQLSPGQVLALKGIGLSQVDYTAFTVAMTLVNLMVCLVVSTVIVWRRPDDRMAFFVALMLVAFGPIGATNSVSATSSPWRIANECLTFLALALLVLVFLLFPSGEFVPRWTRWTLVVFLAGLVPEIFVAPFMPNTPVDELGFLVVLVELAALALVQVYRYRRVSNPFQRQQTKWVVFGLAVMVIVAVSGGVVAFIFDVLAGPGSLYWLATNVVGSFVVLLLPLSFGFAMLRYRLWEIDVLINRTLVYGALTLSVIGLYVLVVVGLGTLIQVQGNVLLSLLATGLIAVLFQPLRERLQRGVNHLLYGERDDPYAVLTHLGSRLEATLVPEKVLPTIVETVAQALKLPYVAIALLPEQSQLTGITVGMRGDRVGAESGMPDIVASFGEPPAELVRVPLVYQAETIGSLLLAARTGDTFSKADTRLLTDLARQAGVAVYAVRLTTHLQHLTASLQQAREHLVKTREEERRRLRRDLHDGLGPTLASLTFKVDAARNLFTQDSMRVDRLLSEVRQQAQEAIADIRRLVYNLRPPALDELGLLSALRELAAHYQHQGLEVVFDVPPSLPPLPAAVEVAVYRIAQEALTNVARHAQAQHCLLRLSIDHDALHLDIVDDGQGIPAGHRIGIGLHTMHERASELGGSCTITAGSPGGTTIQVRLPLAAATEDVPATSPLEPEQPEQESTLTPDASLVRQEE